MTISERLINPIEEEREMFTKMYVQDPVLEDGNYTSYAVVVETNNPCFSLKKTVVRRRYSEFIVLREMLVKQHPCVKPPLLPGKSPFRNRFNASFIEKRRDNLEIFLNNLVAIPIYLSNKSVHLFVQSTHTMQEIKNIVTGKSLDLSSTIDHPVLLSQRFEELYSADEFLQPDCVSDSNWEKETSDHFENKTILSTPEQSSLTITSFKMPEGDDEVCHSPRANSTSTGKKVSFCSEVTVAQVHA